MALASQVFNARYQLAPFTSAERTVVFIWLLLSLLFFFPSDHLPTPEQAAQRAVSILTNNRTNDDCQLCHAVLQSVDLTQATSTDPTAKNFESFLGRADEQLLMACQANPDERGCDTLRVKVEGELKAYTNVILEQMLSVTSLLDYFGNGVLTFLDEQNALIRSYVSVNKVRPLHSINSAELARHVRMLFRNHMWLQEYPGSHRHHKMCAFLCEKRVNIFQRVVLHYCRVYVHWHVRLIVAWLQQEHFPTFLVITLVGALLTVVLRRLLAPLPTFPSSCVPPNVWGPRAGSDQATRGGSLPSAASSAPTASRSPARNKHSSRRR